jgi:hypothetical protein
MSETDPAARAAYLAALDDEAHRMGQPARPREHRGLPGALADAEQVLAQTEADWERASSIAMDAWAAVPGGVENAAARYMAPDARHAYITWLNAEEGARRAEQAYLAARRRMNQLLEDFENVQRDDWNLPPGGDDWWRL